MAHIRYTHVNPSSPEQSDFFYLMQRTFEKTAHGGYWNRFLSRLYRWFSNYGQSTLKPCLGLLLSWIIFGGIYSCINMSHMNTWQLSDNLLTSLQQMIRPYYLILSSALHQSNLAFYIASFCQSTLTIFLIATFIIALKCNFTKR